MADFIFHTLILVVVIVGIFVLYRQRCPPPMPTKCDCSAQLDEGYDMGYVDGVNLSDVNKAKETKEGFVDFEYGSDSKKYEQKTGSKFVSPVGGVCPRYTQMVTGGKWKGKCRRTGDWYKAYRGKSADGRLFTCTGGRVSNGSSCVCDTASGKTWNGNKCSCDNSKGLKWDSNKKRCVYTSFKGILRQLQGSSTCKYSSRIFNNGQWVCPTGMIDTGLNWGDVDGGTKQCRTRACPQPKKQKLTASKP